MSFVVVVFPLLPVIPRMVALVNLDANSISEITGIPRCFNSLIKTTLSGMPGLLITSEASKILICVCCNSSYGISAFYNSNLNSLLISLLSEKKNS